jgi:hypothetical protein
MKLSDLELEKLVELSYNYKTRTGCIETSDSLNYFKYGEYHRLLGPALTYKADNVFNIPYCNKWFFNGELIDCSSQEEFERIIKLKHFW